ncbi:MAG TPA: CBS domain-containing protein [Actinomycetota bacterium]|nr:CBS domain-containing protein [Actinomycetota bacterium]
MRIKDLKPRGAITVARGETLRAAAKHLADDDIGALVVFNASGAVGIFSERDLARAVADGADLDEEQVEEYMTQSPLTVENDSGIGAAIAKMNDFGVRHLVVVEERDVVGMISMRDLIGLLGTAWPEL